MRRGVRGRGGRRGGDVGALRVLRIRPSYEMSNNVVVLFVAAFWRNSMHVAIYLDRFRQVRKHEFESRGDETFKTFPASGVISARARG